MRVGNFSLLVVGGKEVSSGHVLMKHSEQYTLRLGNHSHRRCDAVVVIDGKDVGTYRIQSDRFIMLERSLHDNGRFTFFSVNSNEAVDALVDMVQIDNRGLIQVRFRPERVRHDAIGTVSNVKSRMWKCIPTGNSDATLKSADGLEAGITGLTGHSDQRFVNVEDIEWSPEDEVVVSVRLVADTRETVRPLQGVKSNPVPRPV